MEKQVVYGTVDAQEKPYNETLLKYREEARRKLIPLCETCMRFDFRNGELNNDWQYYTSLNKAYIKTIKAESVIQRDKDGQKILAYETVYECSYGHRLSVVYSPAEKEALNPKTEDGKGKK